MGAVWACWVLAAETTTNICTETIGGVKEVVGEIIQAEDRELERGQALGLGAFLVLGV